MWTCVSWLHTSEALRSCIPLSLEQQKWKFISEGLPWIPCILPCLLTSSVPFIGFSSILYTALLTVSIALPTFLPQFFFWILLFSCSFVNSEKNIFWCLISQILSFFSSPLMKFCTTSLSFLTICYLFFLFKSFYTNICSLYL